MDGPVCLAKILEVKNKEKTHCITGTMIGTGIRAGQMTLQARRKLSAVCYNQQQSCLETGVWKTG